VKLFPLSNPAPNVVVVTLGCKLNQAESEKIVSHLTAAGCRVTDRPEPAGAFVINTCAVTHIASRKSRHYIRLARRLSPNSRILVTGCSVDVDGAEAMRRAGADLVFSNEDKYKLAERLLEEVPTPATGPRPPAPFWRLRTRSFVKIQEGCNQVCSFCVVPRARGPERSIPEDEIVREVQRREREGVTEVVLTGTQLGAYGKDGGRGHLVALISMLLRETSVPRIRVSSLQPPDFTPELLGLWADSRLCRHFHIPLQSGSDDLLKRMRRLYASGDFRRTVLRVWESVPCAAVTTDVMAGFPGETEADFEATYRACEGLELSDLHVFPFSRRPGTIAAAMSDQVPETVKRERVDRLLALAGRLQARFLERFEGATVPVLWEKPASADGLWEGLTDNYVRVLARSERPLQNAVVLTRLLHRDNGALRGELVD
jgi:threonylcarbamoyladenosine tRNA methylthiotransferase MtaB